MCQHEQAAGFFRFGCGACVSQSRLRGRSSVREPHYSPSLFLPRRLTVPNHRELARGTLRALIREAGLTKEQFTELL